MILYRPGCKLAEKFWQNAQACFLSSPRPEKEHSRKLEKSWQASAQQLTSLEIGYYQE